MAWRVQPISDSSSLQRDIDANKIMRNDVIANVVRGMIHDFKAHGVPVNSSCRLAQYASLFDSNLVGQSNEDTESKLDSAFLEILQYRIIHRSFMHAATSPKLLAEIAVATGGCVDPMFDKADCKARSTQFELYVWSYLTAAGLEVTFREPDLTVRIGKRTLAIAAKRSRSRKKIFKNLRNGCHQITKSKIDGFVTIDLSFVESLSKPVYVAKAQHLDVLSVIILDSFVRNNMQEICATINMPSVIGVLFHYSTVVRTVNESSRAPSRRWLFLQTREPPLDQETLAIIERIQSLGQGNFLSEI